MARTVHDCEQCGSHQPVSTLGSRPTLQQEAKAQSFQALAKSYHDLLGGHTIKPPSTFLSPYPHSSAALRPHHRSFFVQWTTVGTDTHHCQWDRYITTHPRLRDRFRRARKMIQVRGQRDQDETVCWTQQDCCTHDLMVPCTEPPESASLHGLGRPTSPPLPNEKLPIADSFRRRKHQVLRMW